MKTIKINARERDAIWAGLRLLQNGLLKHEGFYPVTPDDGEFGEILTDAGSHTAMNVDEIEDFIFATFEAD